MDQCDDNGDGDGELSGENVNCLGRLSKMLENANEFELSGCMVYIISTKDLENT